MRNDLKELGLTKYQREQILREVLDLLSLNETNSDTYPDHCPKCGDLDSKFIKKGTNTGKQRYQCKECLSVFDWDFGKLTYWSQVKQDKWNIVIQGTLNLVSILDTATKANLSSFTVFKNETQVLTCTTNYDF